MAFEWAEEVRSKCKWADLEVFTLSLMSDRFSFLFLNKHQYRGIRIVSALNLHYRIACAIWNPKSNQTETYFFSHWTQITRLFSCAIISQDWLICASHAHMIISWFFVREVGVRVFAFKAKAWQSNIKKCRNIEIVDFYSCLNSSLLSHIRVCAKCFQNQEIGQKRVNLDCAILQYFRDQLGSNCVFHVGSCSTEFKISIQSISSFPSH